MQSDPVTGKRVGRFTKSLNRRVSGVLKFAVWEHVQCAVEDANPTRLMRRLPKVGPDHLTLGASAKMRVHLAEGIFDKEMVEVVKEWGTKTGSDVERQKERGKGAWMIKWRMRRMRLMMMVIKLGRV